MDEGKGTDISPCALVKLTKRTGTIAESECDFEINSVCDKHGLQQVVFFFL
jgi:hypothetical protein